MESYGHVLPKSDAVSMLYVWDSDMWSMQIYEYAAFFNILNKPWGDSNIQDICLVSATLETSFLQRETCFSNIGDQFLTAGDLFQQHWRLVSYSGRLVSATLETSFLQRETCFSNIGDPFLTAADFRKNAMNLNLNAISDVSGPLYHIYIWK